MRELTLVPGYSGRGYASWPGPGGSLRWNVAVGAGGRYRLRMRIVSPDGAERQLDVNTQAAGTVQFPATGFRSWADGRWVEYAVDLHPGRNTITWTTRSGDAGQRSTVRLVKFDVVELVRDAPTGGLR